MIWCGAKWIWEHSRKYFLRDYTYANGRHDVVTCSTLGVHGSMSHSCRYNYSSNVKLLITLTSLCTVVCKLFNKATFDTTRPYEKAAQSGASSGSEQPTRKSSVDAAASPPTSRNPRRVREGEGKERWHPHGAPAALCLGHCLTSTSDTEITEARTWDMDLRLPRLGTIQISFVWESFNFDMQW